MANPSSQSSLSNPGKRKTDDSILREQPSIVPPEPTLGEILQRTQGPSEEPTETGPPRADSLAVLLGKFLDAYELKNDILS